MPQSKRSIAKRNPNKVRTSLLTRMDDRGRHEQKYIRLTMSLTILGAKLKERQTHGLQCLIGATQEIQGY